MSTQIKKDHVYVRFTLLAKRLTRLQRLALSGLGVECVDDGKEHEAYGIIPNDIRVIEHLQSLGEFAKIELGEPPSGP